MTVGELSRRTGVPIKAIRDYTDSGLIYTAGRSPSNYRLFTPAALWCVQWVGQLRGLGLTLAEIRELARDCPQGTTELIGPRLADRLRAARSRLDARIAELQRTRDRIDEFEAIHHAQLAGRTRSDRWVGDPQYCADCA
jgi:DNA-binding transcriptional MerR regulator